MVIFILRKKNKNRYIMSSKDTKKSSQKFDVYKMITDAIIAKLESGVIPWKKPWNVKWTGVRPTNYLTKKPYKGVNSILLNPFDFEHPYYLTFKQALQLGGSIIKGSKSLPVVYWNIIYYDKDGKKCERKEAVTKSAFLKYFNVFNISQIEGIEFDIPKVEPLPEFERIEKCEATVKNMPNPPKIVITSNDRCFYSPVFDQVSMARPEFFNTPEDYYSTLFHELVHSTGHQSRLKRDGITKFDRFGSENYGYEELVAELGAYFLSAETGIDQPELLDKTASYISSWIKVLKDDHKMIVKASSLSLKAVEYIIGNQQTEIEDQENLAIAS